MNRSVWDGDWMIAKETPMDDPANARMREMAADPAGRAIEDALQRVAAKLAARKDTMDTHAARSVIARALRDSHLLHNGGWVSATAVLEALDAEGYTVAPRASQAAIGLDRLAKLAEQAIADHSVCVNEGCPDERIIPPSLRWFVEDYLPAALADGAAPRASQAATATNDPGDDAGAAHDPHGGSAGRTEPRMLPEDVPEEILNTFAAAGYAAMVTSGVGGLTDRCIAGGLAAVIPAIRQQAHTDGRAETLAQLQAALVKLRAACTYQDELAAQYRIGLNDALDALDRIARGDQ